MRQDAETRSFTRTVHRQRLTHLSDGRLQSHWSRQVLRDPSWQSKQDRSIYTGLLIEAAEERGITLTPTPEAR